MSTTDLPTPPTMLVMPTDGPAPRRPSGLASEGITTAPAAGSRGSLGEGALLCKTITRLMSRLNGKMALFNFYNDSAADSAAAQIQIACLPIHE